MPISVIEKRAFQLGCLLSVLAPLMGLVLYPKATWLFVFLPIGIILIIILTKSKHREDVRPGEIAGRAERLLGGYSRGWDVDDYEHLHPKDQQVRDLWLRTMAIGGLPEEWHRLDGDKKSQLLEVIQTLRELAQPIADTEVDSQSQ